MYSTILCSIPGHLGDPNSKSVSKLNHHLALWPIELVQPTAGSLKIFIEECPQWASAVPGQYPVIVVPPFFLNIFPG